MYHEMKRSDKMARIPRNSLCGNFLHVIVQGINREKIFSKEEYKKEFKRILVRETSEKGIDIIAYCIMDNHAHLLYYIDYMDKLKLSECMHKINTLYAIFYNKKENRVGVVYRNRYYTKPINDLMHLTSCIVYIHRNPVKAGIVKNEMQYKYSSFNEYYGDNKIISMKPIETIYGNVETCKRAMEQIGQLRSKDFETEDDVDYEELVREYIKRQVEVDAIIKILDEKYEISSRKIASLVGTTRYYVRKVI